MTEQQNHPTRRYKSQAEVDELLKNAPVMTNPDDFANPNLFPDDHPFFGPGR
jgi:hypothetical protein